MIRIEKKQGMLLGMGAVCFICYQMILFVLTGFAGHGAVYWESYLFMLAAFGTVALSMLFRNLKRDWLFGYSVFWHNTVYLLVELVLSTIFITLDKRVGWAIPFAIQFLVFCVHLFFVISAFYSRETVQELEETVKTKTQSIRALQAEVENICDRCKDEECKKRFYSLAEKIRFSDAMSSNELTELENELSLTIMQAGQAVSENRISDAFALCEKAELLLSERNRKCKIMK